MVSQNIYKVVDIMNELIDMIKKNSTITQCSAHTHVDSAGAKDIFKYKFSTLFSELYNKKSDIILLCIGTDRSTGDCLGPLTGTKLIELGIKKSSVYGTLDNPIHAINLQDTIHEINEEYNNPFVIAIDSSLTLEHEHIGTVVVKNGSLKPGSGVNKILPEVGNMNISGIVNIGGFMEYIVLQNTRLSLVMKMANIISKGIAETLYRKLGDVV